MKTTLLNRTLSLAKLFSLILFISLLCSQVSALADSVVNYSLTGPTPGGTYTLTIISASPPVTDMWLVGGTENKYYFDKDKTPNNWTPISHGYPNGTTGTYGLVENTPTSGLKLPFTINIFMYGLNQPPPKLSFSYGDDHTDFKTQNLVPEPATMLMGLLGLAGFAVRRLTSRKC